MEWNHSVPLEAVSFNSHSWSDHYVDGRSYSLTVKGINISLEPKDAEKIMLATGIGTVVWTVDWALVGGSSHSRAIQPRIQGIYKGNSFESKDAAETAIKAELQARIDALKKMGGF